MNQKEAGVIAGMRMMTEWTGQLTEAQVKTLNVWPTLLVEGLKKHRIAINLEERKVTFHLTFKARKKLKTIDILKHLEAGVWMLLGDSWSSVFKSGRRIMYAGTRRAIEDVGQRTEGFGEGRKGFNPERT